MISSELLDPKYLEVHVITARLAYCGAELSYRTGDARRLHECRGRLLLMFNEGFRERNKFPEKAVPLQD